jgi:hypothetical protein
VSACSRRRAWEATDCERSNGDFEELMAIEEIAYIEAPAAPCVSADGARDLVQPPVHRDLPVEHEAGQRRAREPSRG